MSPFTALINSTPSLNHLVRTTEPKEKCPAMTILVISFIFLCLFESSLSAPGRAYCPVFMRPPECPESVKNSCENDAACPPGLKCCNTGCERDCVRPDSYPYDPVVTPVPPISCSSPVDVAFIVDSSGSIGRRNFLKQKEFVKEVASNVRFIGKGQSRAAIVLYSNSASVKARFGQYATTKEFNRAVDSLPWERGYTRIDRALDVAATEVFPESRKDLPKTALLITDGTQTKAADAKGLMEASEPLRKAGVRVLVVGVGRRVDKDELRLVTESDDDVMLARDFDDLLVWWNTVDVTRKVCQRSVRSNSTLSQTPSASVVSPTGSPMCPSFEFPAECPDEPVHYCNDDVDCSYGRKCCNTGCAMDCVAPDYGPVVTPVSPTGSPMCPSFELPAECPEEPVHYCNDDVVCPYGRKCCNTGCAMDCVAPDYGPVVTPVSPTGSPICPSFQPPAECPEEVLNFCSDHTDCPYGLKCCNTGCEMDCVRISNSTLSQTPSASEVSPSGSPICPLFQSPAECPEETENFCNEYDHCPYGLKCCNTGCEMDCVPPDYGPVVTTPATSNSTLSQTPSPSEVSPTGSGVCPAFEPNAECPEEPKNFCNDDADCPHQLKCCNTGCEMDCVVPDFGPAVTTPDAAAMARRRFP